MRESHKRIDPTLEPLPDDPTHRVACLLDSATRKRIWKDLVEGSRPEEARALELEGGGPR